MAKKAATPAAPKGRPVTDSDLTPISCNVPAWLVDALDDDARENMRTRAGSMRLILEREMKHRAK